MLTIHLRINDAATGKPVPVRLQITGPDGTFHAPLGRSAEFPTARGVGVGGHLRLDRERWVYVDGSCEVKLPAGVSLRVRAIRGPEFTPLDEMVTLGPGQMALRFTLHRWSDLRAAGWVPGDTRCHFLSPHAALLEAAAEDLDVVNLLAAVHTVDGLDGSTYPLATDMLAFSGQAPALEADGRFVAVNTLNTHPVLGRVGLLHSHRPVFPLTFGPPDDTNDWSVCDWCDQCHRKGGLTVWVEPFRTAAGVRGGEAIVAAVLGKVDAIELTAEAATLSVLPWVYQLWNAGFPLPLAGGSGKDDNRTPLGAVRTYARIGASGGTETAVPVNRYRAWVEAVRAGRTFVTSGPLLTWEHDAGRIRAVAQSVEPFGRLEAVADGQVIGSADATRDPESGLHRAELEAATDGAGWVAARCVPPAGSAFAHSSLVRLGPSPRQADAAGTIRKLVQGTRTWIEDADGFASPKSRQHLLDVCDAALARLPDCP